MGLIWSLAYPEDLLSEKVDLQGSVVSYDSPHPEVRILLTSVVLAHMCVVPRLGSTYELRGRIVGGLFWSHGGPLPNVGTLDCPGDGKLYREKSRSLLNTRFSW